METGTMYTGRRSKQGILAEEQDIDVQQGYSSARNALKKSKGLPGSESGTGCGQGVQK